MRAVLPKRARFWRMAEITQGDGWHGPESAHTTGLRTALSHSPRLCAARSHSPLLRATRSGIAACGLTLQNPQAHEFHREAIALLAAIADDIMLLQGV